MPSSKPTANALLRLRKHADYQRVYADGRKQFSKQMSFFYSVRPPDRRSETPGARVGLTVGKALGKAVDRNRIKRRLRECARHQQGLLRLPVDVILHPRRTALKLEFGVLEREVAGIFREVERAVARSSRPGGTERLPGPAKP